MSVDPFEALYRDRFGELVQLATAMGATRAVAEDIVQDAFARLYTRYQRVEHPVAYLRRSVVNGSINRARKHRREDLVEGHEDSADRGDEPAERIDLERRLDALPPRQRAAVVLRVHVGLSEIETAEVLDCRPGTVGSLLHRALGALRVDLEEVSDAERR